MSSSEPFSYGGRLLSRMRALSSQPAHPVDVNDVRELVPWDGVNVAIADRNLSVKLRRQEPEDGRVEAFLDEFDRLHRVYFDVDRLDRELKDPPIVWPELRRWLIERNRGMVGTTVPTEPREDIDRCLSIIGASVEQLQGLS